MGNRQRNRRFGRGENKADTNLKSKSTSERMAENTGKQRSKEIDKLETAKV